MVKIVEKWHGTIGGYSNHRCKCKKCLKAWREYNVQLSRRRQRALTERLGGKCAYCGENDFDKLYFDHIDNTLKPRSIRVWMISEERLAAEIENLQVLCFDCHIEKCRIEYQQGSSYGASSYGRG